MVEFQLSGMQEFLGKMKVAKADLKQEIMIFLEGLGMEFLRVLEDEIMRKETVNTRLLLASFQRGSQGNVWEANEGDLSLEIGTNVKYAAYVNDGHWTNPQGTSVRFVPGVWSGGNFVYQPGADTGMVLKQKWVEGSLYWDRALLIIEQMFPQLLEAKVQQWMDSYFGGA